MSDQTWFGIPIVVDPDVPPGTFRFEVDTDTRCPHQTPAGQCLDHQGHLGDHQYPQETR